MYPHSLSFDDCVRISTTIWHRFSGVPSELVLEPWLGGRHESRLTIHRTRLRMAVPVLIARRHSKCSVASERQYCAEVSPAWLHGGNRVSGKRQVHARVRNETLNDNSYPAQSCPNTLCKTKK